MRVGIDANLSYRTVAALNALYADPQNASCPTFECVGAGEAQSDAPWISEFAKAGGTALIGVDKRILARPHEVKALAEAGLSACFLDFGKGGAALNFQSGSIVNLWPRLHEIWLSANQPIILRAKVLQTLSWHQLEQLEFELDGEVPKVRHSKFRDD